MKIFILGLTNSGRTTISKSLADQKGYYYISAMDWIRSTFRSPNHKEDRLDYERSFIEYLSERIKVNQYFITDNIEEIMKTCHHNEIFIIDGLSNPQNFIRLFDYTKDILIVLNRIDNDVDSIDQDNIALNIVRDYCYWLSSMELLSKDRWIEYNFRINAKAKESAVKKMGSRNMVYIVNSIENVISHLKDLLISP